MKRWMSTSLILAAALPLAEFASSAAPERNNRHALIIGIGKYSTSSVPPLHGVPHDMESARAMAKSMSIPEANMVFVRDSEATAQNLRAQIKALDQRIQPGDRVFIYYSGHGTRWYDPDASMGGGCTEGLIASDGAVFTNQEIGQLLKPIAQKTDKLMVFYDACFSGGIAQTPMRTRSLKLDGLELTPKFANLNETPKCQQPSNFRTRALNTAMQKQGALPENIVHIAASRPDEASFDSPRVGGMATVAWRDCLLGDARSNGTGSVTVEDITVCAQQKLDERFVGLQNISGQHMTIGGNRQFVPSWIKASFAAAPPAVVSTTVTAPPVKATPAVATTPAVTAPPPKPAAEPAPATPAQILASVNAQRDGARSVQVKASPAQMKIGKDKLNFTVTSKRDGYLYVALAGSDQKSLYLLYPNALDGNNAIQANKPVTLPRPGWEVMAGGPAGTDTLLVLVTDSPRRLDDLKATKEGPFMKTLLDSAGRSQLQRVLSTSANDSQAQCQRADQQRSANQALHCSDAFGSSLLTVKEVQR